MIQRGEDVVSGRMMPTLAPLPSTVPLAEPDELAEGELELELEPLDELLLDELEPQAARDIAAATPSAARHTPVLRMRCLPFPGEPLSRVWTTLVAPMIVVRVNISL